MKIKLDRIISIATLVASLGAIVLVMKKPAPVAQGTQASAGAAANSQSINSQPLSPEAGRPEPAARQAQPSSSQAQASGGYSPASSSASSSASQPVQNTAAPQSGKATANGNSNTDVISAAVNHLLGPSADAAAQSPDSEVGSGSPNIKDQKVTYEGDMVHGQFLTEIGGRDVWVTISGHMGQKDGYATFDPTEFKVGDVDVPVSLVNPALQRKLAEERDRLKLPDAAAQ
jgi:hypothetical protein